MPYNREKAVSYAHKWAFKRNPQYYNFDPVGGDCTSFVSQCLYAGAGVMNYTRDTGWYYTSATNRAAAWSGVEYLYRFLTTNHGRGPQATELPLSNAQMGDIVQLSFTGEAYGHSLFVVGAGEQDILVAAHTPDADYRPLHTYFYQKARLLHIERIG